MILPGKIIKSLEKLSNNIEEEYRKMPLFKKVLTFIGAFFFFGGAFALIILLFLGEKHEITLYIPHLRVIAPGVWGLGTLIFAYCFKNTTQRLFLICGFLAILSAFIGGPPELKLDSYPKIFKYILSGFVFFGVVVFGVIALRYYLENKKALERPLSGGTGWGIKISPGFKYLFEMLNLSVVFINVIGPGALFHTYFKDSMSKVWPVFIMFFLMIIVFVVWYYVNTRYIFQGLLLPPGKMKKFLLIVHVLFYSVLFLAALIPALHTVAGSSRGLIALIVVIAGMFILFILSFLGTYYGSRIAKKQLTAVWEKRVDKGE
jgi:hypothetical protein